MDKVGISVRATRDKVVVEFSEKVDHLEFNPQEAGEFAKVIIEKAMKVNGDTTGSNIIIPGAIRATDG